MPDLTPSKPENSSQLCQEGYAKALDLLTACVTAEGFLASPTDNANYRRIWARDGVILGLAALLTSDHELIDACRSTLTTLARYQGPHGEIPSNVDPKSERISYGGTTGRVDANLWFLIGCAEYWQATGDDDILLQLYPAMEKVRFLLGAWEYNNRGLLYVPQAGDWADEYLHSGYVLYDQLLYLQAQRSLAAVHTHIHGSSDHVLQERISRLRHLITANYWFNDSGIPDDAYHEVLYQKGRDAAPHCAGNYWLPFFSPTGYGYRFDGFANILASLLNIANNEQRRRVDRHIHEIAPKALPLIPAFHPAIQPIDEDWKHLQMTFSYTFKNKPYEFHNGGLWPLLTGFYIADLAQRNDMANAKHYLFTLHQANAMEMEGEAWAFPEYIHGQQLRPGGTRAQGWSAAAAVIGHHAVEGARLLRIDGND